MGKSKPLSEQYNKAVQAPRLDQLIRRAQKGFKKDKPVKPATPQHR